MPMVTARRLGMVMIVALMMRQPVIAQGQLAAPAPELTIEEAVARAIADNPDLRAARAEVRSEERRVGKECRL